MEPAGLPHEALFLVLAYLPLQQLLSMSQVCKTFRDAVSSDVLIWLDLVVERPLSLRLTDEFLLRVTSKAHGRLRTVALLNCVRLTDDGLLRVVKANPLLSKLYVPACTGLTAAGVLRAVRTLTEESNTLTSVKIDGIYNITQDQLLLLQYYVPRAERKPRFYHKYQASSFYSIQEDDCSIDVEICPKCKEVKLVFNCSRETCWAREGAGTECLGCTDCVPRCGGCGRCISVQDEDEIGETICNDTLCLDCWLRFPKCNFCNKPFCPQHTDEQLNPAGSGGFVCQSCQFK